MKISLDTETRQFTYSIENIEKTVDLYSKEAFEVLSRHWVRLGWNMKHLYTFSWMGRPIIQLPDDMLRIQEVIYHLKPDVIVETGVAHGGSLIFYSSLCKAMDKGRIIGIDIEIRPHNRKAIEAHPLNDRITLIEGSSTAPETLVQVKSLIKPGETVLVILDSDHSYKHVAEELRLYSGMTSVGSYIVATDGIMNDLIDVPRGHVHWKDDNPEAAARDFAKTNSNFVLEQPGWPFNESDLDRNITHWLGAWLKRVG